MAATSLLLALVLAGVASAASPQQLTLSPDRQGKGEAPWTGSVSAGSAAGSREGEGCSDSDGRPNPAAGCDFLRLDVSVPQGFWQRFRGGLDVSIGGFGSADLDLYVYRRNPDGTAGDFVQGSGNLAGQPESLSIRRAEGSYWVVALPVAAGSQGYRGKAELAVKQVVPATELNRRAPPGFRNYRASHDRYTSHSETSIAMDPQNHDHLMAASKMYENNPRYLFKVGTYESFDGGRTWQDQDQLPGYCQAPGQCDRRDRERYRITSDPSVAFDDEGNAYVNVLDAPGGVYGFRAFNMTVHIKRPGEPWSGPITVHDNRGDPVSEQALLDDKNWIAVDNARAVGGGPNRPGDGKVGPIYICWSLDTTLPAVPGQAIVIMRSLDGGKTWGGLSPGDNLPLPLSPKVLIGGIGCQISIGPRGEVYVTWYDNQLGTLFNVVSTDQGRSFSPPRPVAQILGVNGPFTGQAFRNISIPSTAVGPDGTLYVVVASCDAQDLVLSGHAQGLVLSRAGELAEEIKRGDVEGLLDERERREDAKAEPPGACAEAKAGSDIALFRSADGGESWSGPVRVNRDSPGSHSDQFQPAIAVTPKGQVEVSYFDKRSDPENYYIETWLSRSNDGGQSFHDTRVSERMWDPAIGAPVSPSGEFIGDYQGLVADDEAAIPFWNDTQLATNLDKSDPRYSPWQEVFAARVPNGPASFILRPADRAQVSSRRGGIFLTVRGRAFDPSGGTVRRVRVALRRQRGKRCWYLVVGRRRFVRGSCAEPRYSPADGSDRWTVSFRRSTLRPGFRYTVLSSAVNYAGKAERPDEPGRNQARLRVRRNIRG